MIVFRHVGSRVIIQFSSILRVLMTLLFCTTSTVSGADTFTFSNASGPYAVGVKVVQQYDRSRLYKMPVHLYTGEPTTGERVRPIQTIVWYPAEQGGKRQTFRDYMETIPTEDDFARSSADSKRLTQALIDGFPKERRVAMLQDISRSMLAVRDAREKNGRFPVVIYAPSLSASAVENADMCEYLASHGYLVLSSPSLGEHSHTPTMNIEGVEPQANDISYLIGYASSYTQADMTKVAVVGFSWGGLSNVVAAAKDARIKALVNLEGSLRYFPELIDGGKDAAKYVTPAKVAVPMLYLSRRLSTIESLSRDEVDTRYSFMNQMKYSDVYIVSFMPLQHGDFSSYNQRMAQDDNFTEYSRDEVAQAYSLAARYTRHFLDAYLKNDAAGLAFINNTPAGNKVPAHMLAVDIRRSKTTNPPSRENFVKQLAADGFVNASALYDQYRGRGASFKFDQNEIIDWAGHLEQLNRTAQAREVYRLGTHVDGKWLSAWFGLAGMQLKTGQRKEAAQSYRRILDIEPGSVYAKKQLSELGLVTD